jgi:hypothetical protein
LYTWAVRWYASWLRLGGYSLFPTKSLTRNIGHDSTGENCIESDMFDTQLADYIDVKELPLKENKKYRKAINEFYSQIYYSRWSVQNIKNRLSKLFSS